jgi:hypothetical protein
MRRAATLTASISVALFIALSAGASAASTTITQPRGNPYHIALDGSAKPEPFTVTATGFRPGTLVYVEQCNDRAPGAENWAPTRDCDLGSSPAPVIVSGGGVATFAAGDRNHSFHPFNGSSPQGLFNCLSSNEVSPHNGMPDYRRCQVRVSTNNFAATTDQVFLPIVLENVGGSSGTSGSRTPVALVVAIAVAALLVGVVIMRRRSTARSH